MKLQNSYIFLDKSVEQDKKINTESLKFTKKVKDYIQDIFPDTKKIKQDRTLRLAEYSCEFEIGSQRCMATFIIKDVVKDTYMDIIVEGKTEAKVIKCLENIYLLLMKSRIEHNYIMIVSYDSICEYYCNKIFPYLNKLERNLKKLLFNIYSVKLGQEYYKITTTDDFQAKIKGVIQSKNKGREKEIDIIKNFFYSMTFGDVVIMLFSERWTDIEEQEKKKLLEGNKKLSELSEEQLRQDIEKICPKSDWDRFFNDKITGIDVKAIITSIAEKRNKVAHCKLFYKEDYNKLKTEIDELNKNLEKAIIMTEEEDFKEKNKEYIGKSAKNISDALEIWTKSIVQLCPPIDKMQESISAMIAPLNGIFNSINKTIIPFENTNKSIIQSISSLIDIPNQLGNFSDSTMNMYNTLFNIQNPFNNLGNTIEDYNVYENEDDEKNNEGEIENNDEEK